jgi:ABC-type transport system involved in multi-copper enzyme maturation permease subunit
MNPMTKLLSIEYKKIRTYRTFWILMGLYFLFLTLGLLMAEYMVNHIVDDINQRAPIPIPHIKIYFFPWVWQNMAFFATIRYVLIFPAIVIIILITNEFTFKTIRQNVVTGLSRNELLLAKLELILVISVIMTVFLLIATIILGVSNTSGISMDMVFDKLIFLGGYFLSVLTFLIFALFFGFIFRNTGLSIALFTLYVFIAEPIVYYFLKSPLVFKNNISPFLPCNSFLRLTEYPAIPVLKTIFGVNLQESVTLEATLVALGYSIVMIGVVYIILKKKDL